VLQLLHFCRKLHPVSRLLSFLLFLCSIFLSARAQNHEDVDSLKTLLEQTAEDSVRVRLYGELGGAYLPQEPDSGWRYLRNARTLAQSGDGLPKGLVRILAKMGEAWMRSGQIDSSRIALREGARIAGSENDQAGIMLVNSLLAQSFGREMQLDSMIHYLKLTVAAAEAMEDVVRQGMFCSNLGVMYQYKGQFEKANEYNFKALELKKKAGASPMSIADSYNNIALSYQELGKFEEALEYELQAYEQYATGTDSAKFAQSGYMLGGILFEMELLDSAQVYYDRSLDIFQALGNQQAIALYHVYSGLILQERKDLEAAQSSFQTSLELFPENGSPRMRVFVLSNNAEVLLKLGERSDGRDISSLRKSMEFSRQTYELASQTAFTDQMRKASNFLYRAYDALGKHEQAMEYAKQYMLLNDSLYNEQKQKAVEEIQTKYETEKKEAEIAFLDMENTVKAENLAQAEQLQKNQQLTILVLALGVVATALLLLWIYRIYIQKKKANTELEAKNDIITQQNDEKELLLKEIHHRVKNNLQVVSSLLDLQSMDLDNEEALAAVTDGQNRVKAMALIHEKLYQTQDIASLDFADYVSQLIKQTAAVFPGMSKVKQSVQAPDVQLDIDTAVPLGLILSELLTNAFKYAFPSGEGSLTVQLQEEASGQYLMTVRDSGSGLPEDFELKKAKSLGLKLVRRLSRQLYGSATYVFDNGSCFSIRFKDTVHRKEVS